MPTATELRQQRAKLIADARGIVNKAEGENKRDLTAEENQQFDKLMADADKLRDQADAAERREKLERDEADLNRSGSRRTDPAAGGAGRSLAVTADDLNEALRAWALHGTDHARGDADTLHRAAQCGVRVNAPSLALRALSKGTATAGGHTVPVDMAAVIERQMKFFAPVRMLASSLTTTGGQDMDYPRVNDTGNSATIVGEAGTINTNVDPAFDKVTLKAWKYATTIVLVSIELLQDSSVNVPQLLGELLGERMGRGQSAHLVTGNGTTQPQGMATGAAVGVNLATGNPLTFDKVIDLIYSVDRAYRAGAAFLMHDETLAGLVKIKDTTGQYIWQPGVAAGEPDRIKGYPVEVSNDLTSITSPGDNQPLILFGNTRKYMVRDVSGDTTVTRLNELYAATGQVGFVLLKRTDGRYVGHSGCVKSLNGFDAP